MSSELSFCKTTVLRKQLISPVLLGRSKIGRKDAVLHSLGNQRYANRNVSVKAGFVNNFSTLIVDFTNLDLSLKLLKKFLVFFRYVVS